MTPIAGLAIYLVVWWLVFFVVLPFGVTSQEEEGGVEGHGRDPGAPVRPMLWRKAFVTSLIAGVIWSGVAYVFIKTPFSYDDFPFMPKLHQWPGEDVTPDHH